MSQSTRRNGPCTEVSPCVSLWLTTATRDQCGFSEQIGLVIIRRTHFARKFPGGLDDRAVNGIDDNVRGAVVRFLGDDNHVEDLTLFGGSVESLVMSLVETKHLTPEKLARLQKLVEQSGEQQEEKSDENK